MVAFIEVHITDNEGRVLGFSRSMYAEGPGGQNTYQLGTLTKVFEVFKADGMVDDHRRISLGRSNRLRSDFGASIEKLASKRTDNCGLRVELARREYLAPIIRNSVV